MYGYDLHQVCTLQLHSIIFHPIPLPLPLRHPGHVAHRQYNALLHIYGKRKK